MEINGKKVLTLPQQVLQNQKDIADIKDVLKPYQHNIKIKSYLEEELTTLDGVAYLVIINNASTPFDYNSLLAYFRANSDIEFQCTGTVKYNNVLYPIIAITEDTGDFRVITSYDDAKLFGADFMTIEDNVI